VTTQDHSPDAVTLLIACPIIRPAMAQSECTNSVFRPHVHEWGTFTSVAEADGQGRRCLANGSTDLPRVFVEQFQKAATSWAYVAPSAWKRRCSTFTRRARYGGVGSKINFFQSVVTGWYPHASRVEPRKP